MKNKNLKYRLNSWIVTAVVIIAVILVNAIISSLSAKLPLKLDLTAAKQYDLTDQTKEVMKQLSIPVKLSVLGTEETISPITKEYIDKYKNMSPNMQVEYIDVYKNQSVLYSYQAKGENLSGGDLLFEAEGRYKIVSSSQIYSQAPSLDKDVQNYNFDLESKMTNAVATVGGLVEDSAVYFLEGHGEEKSDELVKAMGTLGYKNSTAGIVNQEIPEDAKLLISVTPSGDFTQEDCEKIDRFLEKGGNLLVIFTPGMPKLERLEKYLAEWGIVPHQDIVVENDPNRMMQSPIMMLPEAQQHEITQTIISQKLPVVFWGAVSFGITESNSQQATTTSIMTTSEKAIGKSNPQSSNIQYEEGDYQGPLNLAVVSERIADTTTRVMVIGSDTAMRLTDQKGNMEFITGSFSWLTNNQSSYKIPPKVVSESIIDSLSKSTINTMFTLLVWILPLLILMVGIVIWLRRRYL